MKTTLLIALTLAACDKPNADPSATTSTASAASVPTQVMTAADPAVTTAPMITAVPTASAAAASGWPLPDYPDAKVTKKTNDLVSLETKDAPAKVVAFYKDKLAAAGFPPGPRATMGAKAADQATVMTASKGAQMVQITVTPVQGTTKISVSSI